MSASPASAARQRDSRTAVSSPGVGAAGWARLGATVLPWLGGLLALALYVRTASPSITWRNGGLDSGDLAAAVVTLGIPHPPGYPLYTLLGYLFAHLPIAAEPAGRLALFSAVAAASAVALIALAAGRILHVLVPGLARVTGGIAATTGALGLAVAPIYWAQATFVEVHGLASLLRALTLVAALAWWSEAAPGRQRALGLLTVGLIGLAASHHLTNAALAWLLVLGWRPIGGDTVAAPPGVGSSPAGPFSSAGRFARALVRRVIGSPAYLGAVIGTLVGGYLLPYAYLPLRAAAQPRYQWGDPTTLAGLYDVMSARIYHNLVTSSWSVVSDRLGQAGRFYVDQLGPVMLALALLGAIAVARRDGRIALALIGPILSVSAFFVMYPARDSDVYLIFGIGWIAVLAAIGVGRALAWVGAAEPVQRRGRIAWPGVASVAIVLGLVLLPSVRSVAANYGRLDLSGDREARQFAETALTQLPPGALLITRGDKHTFSLWYGQAGLGLRPDVAVVDHWLLPFPWYAATIRHHEPAVLDDAEPSLHGVMAANYARRPIYLTDNDAAYQSVLRAEGSLFRLTAPPPRR